MLPSMIFGALALALPTAALVLPRNESASTSGRKVFAHYMVFDPLITAEQWTKDINDAKDAGIDGFALNTAPPGDDNKEVANSIKLAYQAAETAGDFTLFISFDMGCDGCSWNASTVTSFIKDYTTSSAQEKVDGKSFVSTFEGGNWVDNWPTVRNDLQAAGGIYLVPAWTSNGTEGITPKLDVIDGAFNWNAWPEVNDQTKNTDGDKAYVDMLGSKAYMMSVSPWYYTNLPAYNKNWHMDTDSIWFDRWNQVLDIMPQYVEIITWNDYGESTYITDPYNMQTVQGASDYVDGFSHTAYRWILPYFIAAYKAGNKNATVTTEGALFWYRTTKADVCSDGGTTCGQGGDSAVNCAADAVFVMTASSSATTVSVKIGGSGQDFPVDAGVQFVKLPFDGRTGEVTVEINGKSGKGDKDITGDCPSTNVVNFNAIAAVAA